MEKTIAEKAGLTYAGKDALGIDQFIGTDEQWREAERLSTIKIPVKDENYLGSIARHDPEEYNKQINQYNL